MIPVDSFMSNNMQFEPDDDDVSRPTANMDWEVAELYFAEDEEESEEW